MFKCCNWRYRRSVIEKDRLDNQKKARNMVPKRSPTRYLTVRWWPQMDAYGIYKEFGEVMKTTKYSKLQDAEKKYDETDGQTEVDLKHRYSIYYRNTQCSLLFIISIFHYYVFDG
mmetsp:Transcript_7407/g.8618  ORF Transcript_7407/g.8618 Transcript_7407/m.8618 type:complete len:115 (+) Transcript_7407:67-411(+)